MKPESYLTDLIDAISIANNIKNGRDRQVIPLDNQSDPVCFILHKGSVALYRSETNLLVSILHAPIIIGINFLQHKRYGIHVQARGAIRYETTSQTHSQEIIESKGLWKNVAYAFMYYTRNFATSYFSSTGLTSYELVRNNLEELMECDPDLRLHTNACEYIQDKTLLSRSGIMQILSDLKKGGYISMEKGILFKINKLPANY